MVDKETLSFMKEMRDIVTSLIEKQDVSDKRLKDIDDNFHNQSPREFDGPSSVSYGNSGKDTDREDMKGFPTKPATVSTVAKSEAAKKNLANIKKFGDEFADDDWQNQERHEPQHMGEGVENEGMDKGYTMKEMGDPMSHGDLPYRDVAGEDDEMPFGDDSGKDAEIHELREMLKMSMNMQKSITERNELLMKKLEDISKQQSDDTVPLLSQLPVKKSVEDDIVAPTGMWGNRKSLDYSDMNKALGDYDAVVDSLVKPVLLKRHNGDVDISEHALARINKHRIELGDLEQPSLPTYDTGIPGL